jgi:enamine deaminase RidA (YjgF/YER057c/UK114 family)
MEKTVLAPELGDVDSDELDTSISAVGVVTRRDGYRKVSLSGLIWPEGDLETQTKTVLEHVEEIVCGDLGGSMADVTAVRWYVRDEALTPENRARMHETRGEFFELPHYPASTMVGVADLVAEDALVELEAEAEIPDDGWTVEVLNPEEE